MSKVIKEMNGYEKSLEERVNELVKDIDKISKKAMETWGYSIMDIIDESDDEEALMYFGIVKLYKKSVELATAQAKAMDKILEDLQSLKKDDKDLRILIESTYDLVCDLNTKKEIK